MQRLDERKENILDFIVRDYIRGAFPISSGRIFKGLELGVSPATIRNIMLELGSEDFLEQPHTSSGRVPTDKAYRYFVDYLMEERQPGGKVEEVISELAHEVHKRHELLFEHLGRTMARHLRLFTGIARFGEGAKSGGFGLSEVLNNPEFEDHEMAVEFARLADNLEKIAESYRNASSFNEAEVFIGEENPFPRGRAFGAVSLRFADKELREWLVFSLGPKRMDYEGTSSFLNFTVRDIMGEPRG